MANYLKDNDDLLFYLEKGIDWAPLVEATEFGYRTEDGFDGVADALPVYRDILDMFGEFVAEQVAPVSAEIDRIGVKMEAGEAVVPEAMNQIFEQIKELELHGMCLPRELGGMNCPMMLYFVNSELMARADVSVMAHHGFHAGIALAMLLYDVRDGKAELDLERGKFIDTRLRREIEEIVRGEAWGCMDITEPGAGSDMAAIATKGEQDEQGNWFVTGEKIFITSGHGKYHFVIARTEDGPDLGLEGLSFFLVKTYDEDEDGNRTRIVELGGVEEKLGHHGSATASLVFDRAPAMLIGERGEGFKQMLVLMNNARLGVGFECLGLCEAAYRKAKAYAEERRSMGKTIERHEMIADYLEEMRTDIQGLRALCMHGAFHEELAQKKGFLVEYLPEGSEERSRLEREVRRHKRESRRVTPLLKYHGAEKAVELARRCIQIHGGNGYITEYGAEKLLRDAVVMPIYEGTSQIQSLMAMKDTLGAIIKNPQEFVRLLAQTRWRALSARDPLEKRVARIQQLSLTAQQTLVTRTTRDKMRALGAMPLAEWPSALLSDWDPKRDFAFAMLHAERLTKLLTDQAIVELLWDQARSHPERREVLERYLDRCEPRCRFLLDEITTTGSRLLEELGSVEPRAGEAPPASSATAAE